MSQRNKDIQLLIFDVGGVLIDISDTHALSYLHNQGIKPPTNLLCRKQACCLAYESGAISTTTFIEALHKEHYTTTPLLTPALIKSAWQNIIVDFYLPQYQLLTTLRRHCKLIAMSNTNALHWATINALTRHCYHTTFQALFRACYLSFETGLLKPDCMAFETLLHRENVPAENCLFVDDRAENITAAQHLGMQTLQPKVLVTASDLQPYFI